MEETWRELRGTFETAAATYDRARPDYPDALYADLVAHASLHEGSRLLEIGCGTGKATIALLRRGYDVTCVELGADLAGRARSRFRGYPASVHVAPFESWDATGAAFDLVYAATAWHWIDPAVRYEKAHALLAPGGHLAFWKAKHAFPSGFDPFFVEIQSVYEALGEGKDETWPPPTPEHVPDDVTEIEATGLFGDTRVRRYVWETTYTAEQYIALLETFSEHIAMEPSKRAHLFAEVRRRLADRQDGRVRRHWLAILHVARRLEPPT